MPNSRRRMFHTCTGMVLFTVCNTLRGSSTVQDRLRRPHNIRPHFSSPSPYVLSAFCQMRLLYQKPRLREVWRRQNMRAASDQAKPRRLPRRLSPEGSTQPSRTEPKLTSLQKEYATSNSFTICNVAFKDTGSEFATNLPFKARQSVRKKRFHRSPDSKPMLPWTEHDITTISR